MRVLTLWQPWASLVALGVKLIDTRPHSAPRALVGERIAIHASKRKVGVPDCPLEVWRPLLAAGSDAVLRDDCRPLPLGVIVATARLAASVPMVGPAGCRNATEHLCIVNESMLLHSRLDAPWPDGETERVVSDQRPYGHFAPGRWALVLDEVERLPEPVPFRGGQGWSRSWEPS